MPRKPPDHVGLRVTAEAQTNDAPIGDHPFEVPLFYLVKTGSCHSPDVEEAYSIYITDEQRHVIDAALIAKASDEDLRTELSIGPTVMAAYRHLFFDRTVFRHDLDVATYIHQLEIEDEVRSIYTCAVQQGADVLLAKHHIGPRAPLDPKEVLRRTLAAFYERSQAHRGEQITSEAARESLKWAKEAVNASVVLIDKGSNQAEAALKDLRLTLEVRNQTVTLEQIGIKPGEIVGGS
jgi:hypothetical protein